MERKHRKSKLSASLEQGGEDPESLEQTDRVRWIRALVQFVLDADLPVVSLTPEGPEAGAVWIRRLGNRRAKTLRSRARCWKKHAMWLNLVRGLSWPRHFCGCIVLFGS